MAEVVTQPCTHSTCCELHAGKHVLLLLLLLLLLELLLPLQQADTSPVSTVDDMQHTASRAIRASVWC